MNKIDLIIGALECAVSDDMYELGKYETALAAAHKLKVANQELVEALQEMVSQFDQFGLIDCEERAIKDARAILAKHKEQA